MKGLHPLCKQLHYDMHTPGHIRQVGGMFDPQHFASLVKHSQADRLLFFARCAYGWSYYPTEAGAPHPHLTRDVFGQGLEAVRRQGLQIFAYMAVCQIPQLVATAHPDWCARKADGSFDVTRRQDEVVGCQVCPSSAIYSQIMPAQFAELVTKYAVDGIWMDGIYTLFNRVCYCDACQQDFGRPIPVKPEDKDWRLFWHHHQQKVWRILNAWAEGVKEHNPDCPMGADWVGGIRWSVPAPAAFGFLSADPPPNNLAYNNAFHLAAWSWRDIPADMYSQRMPGWQSFGTRSAADICRDFAVCISSGANTMIGDLLQPVGLAPDREVTNLIRRCHEFASPRMELVQGLKFTADVAILSSPEALRQQGNQWLVPTNSLEGAYTTILEAGLSAHIIYDADHDVLHNYKVLVLAEQQYIGRKMAQAIKDFVSAGGGLVVVGRLPLVVDPHEPDSEADPALFEELTGVCYVEDFPFHQSYLDPKDTEIEVWPDPDYQPLVSVQGVVAKVKATTANVLAGLVAPGEGYQLGAKPPGMELSDPGITRHTYGAGHVCFAAQPLAQEVYRLGSPGAKYLLQALIRNCGNGFGEERIGPAGVQLFTLEGEGKTVLNLVSYQFSVRTQLPREVSDPAQIAGVTVKLKSDTMPKQVTIQPEGQSATPKREGDWLLVDVPPFSIHTAVVFSW